MIQSRQLYHHILATMATVRCAPPTHPHSNIPFNPAAESATHIAIFGHRHQDGRARHKANELWITGQSPLQRGILCRHAGATNAEPRIVHPERLAPCLLPFSSNETPKILYPELLIEIESPELPCEQQSVLPPRVCANKTQTQGPPHKRSQLLALAWRWVATCDLHRTPRLFHHKLGYDIHYLDDPKRSNAGGRHTPSAAPAGR